MNKYRNQFLRISAGASLVAASAISAPSLSAQTLSDAVQTGLSSSPVILESIEKARAASLEIDIAKASRRPQVSAQGSAGSAFRDRSIDGVATGSGETLFSRSASVTLEQLLFDWGVTKALVNSAAMRAEFAGYLAEEARQNQAMNIVETYLSVLRLEEQIALLDDKISFLEEARGDASSRENDQGKLDSGVLGGRVALAKADRIQLSGQHRALKARFKVLTTLEPTSLSFPNVPSSLAAYRDVSGSPRYRAAVAAVGASEANLDAIKGEMKPKVFLNASGGLGEDVLGISGPDNSYSVLGVVRWDIFEGGRNRAQREQAGLELSADRAAVESVSLLFDDTFAVAELTAQASEERMNALGGVASEMSSVVQEMEKTMSETPNKVSLLTVVQTRSDINRSQLEGVEAQYSGALARFRALEAAGVLTGYLGAE